MAKILTIIRAIWQVIWTNREIIERHIQWIKDEIAAAKTSKQSDDADTNN